MSLSDAARAVQQGAMQHLQTYRPQQAQQQAQQVGPGGTPPNLLGGGGGGTTTTGAQPPYVNPQDDLQAMQQAAYQSGQIQPPLGQDASGLQASNVVPPGFVPWNDFLASQGAPPDPNATDIFVNPSDGKTIQVRGGPTNINTNLTTGAVTGGVPQFSSSALTKAQLAMLMNGAGMSGGIGGGGGSGGGAIDTGPTPQQQIQNAMNWQTLLNNQKQDDLKQVMDQIAAIRAQQTMQMTAQNNANQNLISAGPNLVGSDQYFGGWAPGGPGPALASMNGLQMGPMPTAGHVVNLNINPNAPPPDPQLQALLARISGGQ